MCRPTIFMLILLPILVQTEICKPSIEMIDASGKVPSGILAGNMVDFGSFDKCLSINHAQYCIVKVGISLDGFSKTQGEKFQQDPMMLNFLNSEGQTPGLILGWCIPDTCPINNVTNFWSDLLEKVNVTVTTAPKGFLCQIQDDIKWNLTTGQWIAVGFLFFILVIMVLSTTYDIYLHYQKKEPAYLLLVAFSVKTNGAKLLSVNNNPDQLPCVHGIRFISMMWVVLGHRYFNSFIEPITNLKDIKTWMDKVGNMYVINAPVSVDTFFVLSGLLVSYVFFLAKEKGVKFNIVLYYVHRYLRLTPVLGAVVLIHATILMHFGSGPTWPLVTVMLKDNCVHKWWSALLYIQNYYNPNQTCLVPTWYLSADFQLFILSPLILIPLSKWPKITMIVSAILVAFSMVVCFVVTWHYELAAFTMDIEHSADFMSKYYQVTHTRYGTWLMGIMLGYYIFTLKKTKNHKRSRLHPVEVCFGWIFSFALMLTALLAPHKLITEPERLSVAFFNGMHRHAWSLGLCWIIFACTQGYGGFINICLSWSAFQVLGRFTYTIYLVHFSLQFMMTSAIRTNTYFSNFRTIHAFWGDLFISLAISVYLTLSFESPMLTIEKVLFKTGGKSKSLLPTHLTNDPDPSASGQTNHGFTKD